MEEENEENKMDDNGYVEIPVTAEAEDRAAEAPEEGNEEEPKKQTPKVHRHAEKHAEKHTEKKLQHTAPEGQSHHRKHKCGWLVKAILVIVVLVLIWNIYNLAAAKRAADSKLETAKLEKIPALIQITKLVDLGCKNCFSIDTLVSSIKANNVNVTKEETVAFNSTQGAALMKKYSLVKIPSVIVTGETNKTAALENSLKASLEKKADAYVFTATKAPYTTADGTVAGLVSAKVLRETSCTQCGNLSSLMQSIEQLGVVVKDQENVWASSLKGQGLIAKYNISIVPAIVLSPEIQAYDDSITQRLLTIFTSAADGSMVQRVTPAPYYDVVSGTVKGLVDITYITDKACTECYNVSLQEQILTNPAGYNLKMASSKTVDVADKEGKALVKKYNITGVPTFVMTSEASAYTSLQSIWSSVGSIEKDGNWVFRDLGVMGVPYMNLTSGEVVQPAAQATQ